MQQLDAVDSVEYWSNTLGLAIWTIWQIATSKSMPNELLAIPVCTVLVDVQTPMMELL